MYLYTKKAGRRGSIAGTRIYYYYLVLQKPHTVRTFEYEYSHGFVVQSENYPWDRMMVKGPMFTIFFLDTLMSLLMTLG